MDSNNKLEDSIPGSERTVSVLAFIVGFFFSFRIAIVLVCVRVLGTEPRTGTGLAIVLNLLLLVLACFDRLGALPRAAPSFRWNSTVRWVLIFLIFSLCSLFWSVTVSLPSSIAYWCEMASDVGIVTLLLRTGPAAIEATSLMKGFIWSSCCLGLLAWMMPAQSDLRLGDPEFFNTNQIGNLCAFAIFLAQFLMFRKQGKWGVAVFFLAIILLRTLSKTTLVAFMVSESFLVVQNRSMSRKNKVLLAVSLIVVVLIFWGLFESYYDVYTNAGNQAETFTGRTAIWAYSLDAALAKPWFGNGFDSMWKVVPPFGPDRFEARHAENELLQQFYAYGVVGVVMLCAIYGSLFRKIRAFEPGSMKMIFLTIMIFIVIRGLAEAEPFDLILPLWAIVLFSTIIDSERFSTQASDLYRKADQTCSSDLLDHAATS
jgi:exopolysaccharide production protein ExoQ